MPSLYDSYRLTDRNVKNPPKGFLQRMKYLGPGLILSASIVGSGELIATTRLGAEAGFVTFWVVIVSCLVKVAVQFEFGKYAIYNGGTAMEALNRLSGPRIKGTHVTVWMWIILMTSKLLQMGGIVGGTSIILNMAFPQVNMFVWSLVTVVAVALMVFRGYYTMIERVSMILIAIFTALTIFSVFLLQYTPYAITSDNILSGLSFDLPAAVVMVAIGAFGITGIGGDEIMSYNYWLIEKGYASYTGPNDGTGEWKIRCRGWVRTMYTDAIFSMIIYTITTAAFYMLGAAILNRQGIVPEGMQLVTTLSTMYTESLGPWANSVFLVAAFVVLFSTLFSALAIWTHLYADAFGQIGWINFRDMAERQKALAWLAWILPVLWGLTFVAVQLPAMMIILGGISTTLILLLVVYAVVQFRYRFLPPFLKEGFFYDSFLWLSILAILMVGAYGLFRVLG